MTQAGIDHLRLGESHNFEAAFLRSTASGELEEPKQLGEHDLFEEKELDELACSIAQHRQGSTKAVLSISLRLKLYL